MVQDLSFGAQAPETNYVEKGKRILEENRELFRRLIKEKGLSDFSEDLKQIHLHLHTPDGSLLDGFARIDDLMPLAKEYGMPAVGVSEHGTMASHFKFYHAAREAGIKPILGMEAYITPHQTWKKADFEKVSYERGEQEDLPKLHYVTKDEMLSQGLTNIIEIKDKKLALLMMKEVDNFFASKIISERERLEEPALTATKLKKEITVLKSASTRNNMRFCVREKQNVANLFKWRPQMNHLLLIAKNDEGYSNLLTLCGSGFLDGFYRKPRIDYKLLKQHGTGLIGTSACLGSDISQCLLKGYDKVAKNLIKFYASVLDEFYLEVQPSDQPEQHYVNKRLIEFSKEMNIPLICTTDVHMLRKEEKPIHASLTTIGKSEDAGDISVYDSCYFMSTEEILGKGIPYEAVLNTMVVANSCNVSLDNTEIKFPIYDVPPGYDFDSYLLQLASEGLFRKSLEKDFDIASYVERLNYELKVIKDKKISAYFIIVWDYINFARKNGILVGAGRGSAAGSLVSYVLGITNIDPIKYDLLFSRFINPERPGFPDIDSDFDYLRRHEIIEYLIEKYGHNRVSQIGTYTSLSTKAVLKDIGRGLNIDHTIITEINKHVPVVFGKPYSIAKCIEEVPIIQEYNEQYPELFEMALKVEGMPRSASTHACGILVAPSNIGSTVPVMRGKEGEMVSQYDGPTLEEFGFLKFDLLGLKNLSVVAIARDLVKERHGEDLNPDAFEPDDDAVYATIGNGKTLGIFQLESSGMSGVFKGLDTVNFESLIAGLSLYRPGPMDFIPEYQARANGMRDVEYFHPDAEPVLSTSFGIMIYQEQLMRLAGVFGGYSEGQQDTLRKATGKKSQKVMDQVLPELHARTLQQGYDEKTADKLVDLIKPFVGYGLQNV